MEPVRLWLLFVFPSPASFLTLLLRRWRLRLLLFLPLAPSPPALLLYVQPLEVVHGYDVVYCFVYSLVLCRSGAPLSPGLADGGSALLVATLSTVLAAVPLLFVATAVIYYRLTGDAGSQD